MADLLKVNDDNFESEVINSNIPVLADFNATWCGPCKMLAPTVEKLAGEYEGRIKTVSIDVDEAGQTAGKYGIMSIPCLIIFKNGEPVNRAVGLQPEPAVKKLIEEVL